MPHLSVKSDLGRRSFLRGVKSIHIRMLLVLVFATVAVSCDGDITRSHETPVVPSSQLSFRIGQTTVIQTPGTVTQASVNPGNLATVTIDDSRVRIKCKIEGTGTLSYTYTRIQNGNTEITHWHLCIECIPHDQGTSG